MFKKYPYYGWLLIALLFMAVVVFRYVTYQQNHQPAVMANTINHHLQKQQQSLDRFLENESLIKRMFQDSLTIEEVATISGKDFYLYAFKKKYELVFWSSNTVVGTCTDSLETSSLLYSNGVYYKQCLHPDYLKPDEHLVVLFPVKNNYPVQNEYLRSGFVAGKSIPSSASITDKKTNQSFAITNIEGRELFYVQFNQQEKQDYIQDSVLNSFFVLAFLSALIWLHLIAVTIAKRKSATAGLSIVLAAITIILLVSYFTGLPFHIGESYLFSPALYASSSFLSSLGRMFIVFICSFWLLIFITGNFTFSTNGTTPLKKQILYIVSFIALLAGGVLPAYLLKSLVIDSNISFNVIDIASINFYTVVGIFSIVILLGCYVLLVYFCYKILQQTLQHPVVKYLLLAIGILTLNLLFPDLRSPHQYIFWLITFVLLLLFEFFYKGKRIVFLSPQNLFVAIVISLSATFLLHYFIDIKEKQNLKTFAENIVLQRDLVLEYSFRDIADSLQTDPVIQSYLTHPTQENRSFINEHITSQYLGGQLNRYQATIYLFSQKGKAIYNEDTASLQNFDSLLGRAATVSPSSSLYYLENARDGKYYIAQLAADSNSGHIVISFQLKKDVTASVYPELLQPTKIIESRSSENYTYAIYANRELISQNNDFPFPYYVRTGSNQTKNLRILERDGYKVYIYKVDKERNVAVVDFQKRWLSFITLFSYILGIMMLCALMALCFEYYLKYVFKKEKPSFLKMNLRNRIQLAMLGMVVISFLIIAAVTILVFIDRYDNNNKSRLRSSMQTVERSIQHYFKNKNIPIDPVSFHIETLQPDFKTFIANMATTQQLDINVYNSFGSLNSTSQEDIYNKGLLARIMMPEAYYKLSDQQRALLVEEEQIGKLSYLSCYVPLRNNTGQAAGYINVPFFSSQKELNYQISNMLVALINLYAFIFLLSSMVAVGITNWLTRSFQLLIEKFKTVNLNKNETIQWNQNDEIGLLIKEYNSMVETVVENARRLAQSERESAWREMAKQVAHEIKNPLTPMKLNVQYLQQALDRNHPDIATLIKNVSDSLIEQIDHLSYIASAFSDFAKMPQANPEKLLLNEILKAAIALYKNDPQTYIGFTEKDGDLYVHADKNQLMRVFTNLLKNAVEATPENRNTHIYISIEKKARHASITIQDNGSGISDEVATKIFSPYFTTKSSGTGLGLAMTKKIINFWKGKIWFDTVINEGTIFYIELPVMD